MTERSFTGRGVAVAFFEGGKPTAVINCKEIGFFVSDTLVLQDPRVKAKTHMAKALDAWRHYFPDDDLRVIECDYDMCKPSLSFENW